MKWTTKARIQWVVSILPNKLSYATYYWLQTKFGKVESSDPIIKFKKAVSIAQHIKIQGKIIENKTFFELGTGFRLNVPIAFWLMGAKETLTIDLNPYLKWDLILKDLVYIKNNSDLIKETISDGLLDESRFNLLMNCKLDSNSIAEIMDMCNIRYLAPSDASNTLLKDNVIDYHISNDVLEHIPPNIILDILSEGKRITKDDGLFVHMVDFTDHFSHSDKSISSINFLKFSDKKWHKYAGNRYMYMNRLRKDDIEKIFQESGHNILSIESESDEKIINMINDEEIIIDSKFKEKDLSTLSILRAWFITSA